eukprot:TRINITY_DN2533_c0_g2_i1.p1 TRINITY_DN2533_c0_g2~~TRINITY_DN2533_c0_g2_i1.p1  ORF type:complete len:354 (+),score=101.67 TRINITY_DN2533_c0_g2_i1:83-1144(+)
MASADPSKDDAVRSSGMKVVTGNSNPEFAALVAAQLGTEITKATVGKFANGEINISIDDPVRGEDVFVVHPTCSNFDKGLNVNEAVMELLLLIHTIKLSSAKRISAVIPHFAYARQDRKSEARVPISASAVAQLLVNVGVDRVVTVDLHCGQIQGFFRNTPVNNLMASREFAQYLKSKEIKPEQLAVVAPDAGAVDRARRLADKVNAEKVVTILKRRVQAGKVDSMHIAGDVSGMVAVIVDDMTDTSGTLCKAAEVLRQHGAVQVFAMITHGVLTDPACERIEKCEALTEVVVTDTMPQSHNLARCSKLVVLSVAPLIAESIRRIHNEQPMDNLASTAFLPPKRGAKQATAEE